LRLKPFMMYTISVYYLVCNFKCVKMKWHKINILSFIDIVRKMTSYYLRKHYEAIKNVMTTESDY